MADKESIPGLAMKYVMLVAQCEMMRCQIPGNEIDDNVRMGMALFSRCTWEERKRILEEVSGRLYDVTTALLSTTMVGNSGDILDCPLATLDPTVTEAPEQVSSDSGNFEQVGIASVDVNPDGSVTIRQQPASEQ